LFALIVPAAIALAAILGVVSALESGDNRAAIGPLLAAVFAVFLLVRLMRHRS
jgi:flagellar motor component MotA